MSGSRIRAVFTCGPEELQLACHPRGVAYPAS
jgi:hypothetical protein